MQIPSTLIMLPCLTTCVLCLVRFYQAPDQPGITDIRFLSGAGVIVTAIVYLIADALTDRGEMLSQMFFVMSLAWLVWAILLFRRPLKERATLG